MGSDSNSYDNISNAFRVSNHHLWCYFVQNNAAFGTLKRNMKWDHVLNELGYKTPHDQCCHPIRARCSMWFWMTTWDSKSWSLLVWSPSQQATVTNHQSQRWAMWQGAVFALPLHPSSSLLADCLHPVLSIETLGSPAV